MTQWIISANPKMYDHASSFEHFSFIDWRQVRVKYAIGDTVYIYTTKPVSAIQYKCIVESLNLTYPNIRDDKEYWINLDEYYKSLNGKFMRLRLLERAHNKKLTLENLKSIGLNSAPQGPLKVKGALIPYLSQVFSEDTQKEFFPDTLYEEETEMEGVKMRVTVNKYERNPIARAKCIEFYGANCAVCNMDFFEKYGSIGENFIHVHHIIPLNKISQQYKVNFKEDLVPVCPNCHAMLHRKFNGIEPTIKQLRMMLNR